MKVERIAWVLAAIASLAIPAAGEPVVGAEKMACSLQAVAGCELDYGCEMGDPEDWNMPAFIIIDVPAKTLSTTAANERPRATPIQHLERDDGALFLQGMEDGRLFSIVIDEVSGLLSGTVVAPGFNVSAFGTCTPLPILAAGDGE